MKRTIPALLMVFAMLLTAACASKTAPQAKTSYIEALPLTSEEKNLVNLLSFGGSSPSLSHFAVSDLKTVEIKLDVYQKGALTDSESHSAGSLSASEGKIAVMPDRTKETEFNISLISGASTMIWLLQKEHDIGTMTHTDLTNNAPKTDIRDGETYVLYARLFSSAKSMSIPADIMTNPDRLKDFDWAYLVSCRFTSGGVETSAA